MDNKHKLTLALLATSVLAGLTSAPAYAAVESEAQPDTASSSGNDIIVTARRIEERLQDVPISISVFTQEQLQSNNILAAKDIAAFTPSLTVNTRYGTDAATFTLRGFTQEGRTAPTVAIYFADVVSPTGSNANNGGDGAGPGSFFDLQNVQVLKGPQGTLFGRNTTGGAILLVPNKPTDRLEGYVEGSIGNFDMKRVQAVVNLPLADTFKVRLGVDRQKRDGYLKNVSTIGPRRMADVDYVALRGSIVADFTPDIENYTVVSYTDSKSAGNIPSVKRCFPGGAFTAQCNAQVAREAGAGFWAVENSQPGTASNMTQWQVINTTTWRASDTLTIKNTASYAEFRNTLNLDLFGTYWPNPTAPANGPITSFGQVSFFAPLRTMLEANGINSQSTFTEELQFQGGSEDGRLNWQAGLYYESSAPLGASGAQNPNANLAASCTDPDGLICPAGQTLTFNRYRVWNTDYAAYAQATYALTDQLKLTGGIRYTWDKPRAESQIEDIRFPANGGAPTASCRNSLAPGAGTTFPIGERLGICKQSFQRKSSAPTWLINLDYKPIEDIMIYAKYARGYRRTSIQPLTVQGLQTTVKPEKLDTYEVGLKSSWRGAVPGSFNVAAFYNNFYDQQFQIGITLAASPTSGLVNAERSRIYGLEADLNLSPFEWLDLNASYSYLNSQVVRFPSAGVVSTTGQPIAVDNTFAGYSLPFAIPHKVNVGATIKLPIDPSIGKISFGANYVYQSKYRIIFPSIAPGTNTNPPTLSNGADFGNIDGYSFINANVNWQDVAGLPIDASFFVTNLTNKKFFAHINDQNARGFISYFLNEPRMFGARLKYRFGN